MLMAMISTNEMKKGDKDEKSFRIKHDDDKFLSKLLSKDTSKSNPSFRVYYGDVSSSVPFTWETCPGTPKHVSSANSHIPPLTPPPSYHSNCFRNSSKFSSRSTLNFFRRVTPNKPDPIPTSPYFRKRHRWGSSSSFDDRPPADGVRASRLCFGIGNGLVVKRALLCIVGRGSAA